MWIKAFRTIVEEACEPHELKNCSVVIDAQNFFYNCYKESNLHYEFGAECDNYAKYLRDELSMFKEANVTCYFIFKGGTEKLDQKISRIIENRKGNDITIDPIFGYDIHLQVLKEMNFNYMFSEYESKPDCIALAHSLSCPVISRDIEFPIRGVQYIPKNSLFFDWNNKIINCNMISQDSFIRKIGLDKNKLALFILLTDENIFPEDSFVNVFKSKGIPTKPYWRNKALLEKLSNTTEEEILQSIFKHTTFKEELIFEELNKLIRIITCDDSNKLAITYFFNRHELTDWYISGIAANYIARGYVDLYRSKILFKQIDDSIDFMELSLDIIKYAYDLLTDFENDGFKFVRYYRDSFSMKSIEITKSIKNPVSLADQTVSQVGWDNIQSLRLFEHFITEIIHFDCNKLALSNLRDDVKMLMITLVYISHNSSITTFTTEMAYSVLLSYVILGIVKEHINNVHDESPVTMSECKSALQSLYYFHSQVNDVYKVVDKNLVTSLRQFEFCLLEMNNLNRLCGSPFEPTIYSKTYNGSFVYNVIRTTQNEGIVLYVNRKLRCAPNVLKMFDGIVEIYKSFVSLQ